MLHLALLFLLEACGSAGYFIDCESGLCGEALSETDELVTFYALGDWGTGSVYQHRVAELLVADIERLSETRRVAPFVVGLGDNIYELGLRRGWQNGQIAIDQLRETFGDPYDRVRYNGERVIFHAVPGNHDYGKAFCLFKRCSRYGDVLHQETTAEALYSGWWKYYPIEHGTIRDSNDRAEYDALSDVSEGTRSLPQRLDIPSDVPATFVAIDSQVLINLYADEEENARLIEEHWMRLEELLADADALHEWKFVIGHHPVRTHGPHEGRRGFRDFPTWLVDWLLPLAQDIDNREYRRFRTRLESILQSECVIYLAGHDHNLQLLSLNDCAYQIVSGSAAKLSWARVKEDTRFAQDARGFVRIDVAEDELGLQFHCVRGKHCPRSPVATFRLHARK